MPGLTLRASLSALALCAFAAACSDGGAGNRAGKDDGADVPDSLKYGGTVTIGAYGDLQSMNALTSSDNNSNSIQREVLFMPLVKYNEKIEPVPWLAERFDTVRVAGDSLELTFHLRRDVKWHDGKPTTARDVDFTYRRAIDPQTAFPNASAFDYYARQGTLVDEYTWKIRLRPHSEFLDIWYQTPVMPEHILGSVPASQLINHPFGTDRPVGNGPFRFVRRIPNQEWVFEANPDFPEALGGRPYIDRLVYRFVPEQTTLLTELMTGRVDVYLGPNPESAERIRQHPSLDLVVSPFRQWVWIGWNTRLPMFSDARVRRALTMGINRREIVDALLYGYGDVGRSTITPAHWSYDTTDARTLLPYDTAQASRLLTEAGWIDRNNDGVRENAQGQPFRFELKTNKGNEVREDITEIVQAQLKPLGIDVQPRVVEWNTLIEQLQGSLGAGGRRTRDVEAVVSAWVDYFRKDDKDVLHCTNLEKPYQYVGYCNERASQLIDTLGVIMDRQAAAPLWREYQHLMVQESPYTVIYYPKRLTGVAKRLNGEVMDIRGEFNTVARWWIHPSQRRAGGAARPAAAAPAATDTGKK
ncbi:MAG TPA: ABC transporter substrate-binding protein [Gemmatimonadales bacterium]|nr:ABC transporter substrate-binding protein [Gemmatimonadales bacterium]